MPKRSKIAAMPAAVKKWLQQTLIANNFGGYEHATTEANRLLEEAGSEIRLTKSTTHRFGSALERRISAIKATTEAAAMIYDAAPDDEDKRSGAVVSMIQTELFETILKLQEAEGADAGDRVKLLSAAAKNIATLTRASVGLKKFQAEIRTKVQAAANAAAKIGKKGGMSAAGIEQIKQRILGIAA